MANIITSTTNNTAMSQTVLCIAGPTASGKSGIAAELAQRWPIEVINVDSATIYKGMDIGTAKPSEAEQAAINHHLLNILDPSESYSAAAFRHDALDLIHKIKKRGNIPVLCGGTMLYYKVLREGISQLPGATAQTREQINTEASRIGWPAMHAQLAQFDPETAARLKPTDSQRLQRALEIYRSTGITLTEWIAQNPPQPNHNIHFVTLSLEPAERGFLHKRIEHRYHAMLDTGLLEEVKNLYARADLHPGLPSVRCVGYRQLWGYLDGNYDLNEAIARALAATRQLAKRQLTWLRSQPERHTIDCLDPNAVAKAVDFMAALQKSIQNT